MPRKRTEFRIIKLNKPDPAALPVEIGLNLPCMKGYQNQRQKVNTDEPTEEATDCSRRSVQTNKLANQDSMP